MDFLQSGFGKISMFVKNLPPDQKLKDSAETIIQKKDA
jgi:hypothetical protein